MRRVLAAGAVAVVLFPAAPAHAAPAVAADRPSVRLGEAVTVTLTGWPAGVATVALCGNEGRGGSADCAMTAASAVRVPASGRAAVSVRLAAPPVGCPCVLRSAGGGTVAGVPVDVADVPDGAVVAAAPSTGSRAVAVDRTRIASRWGLGALLGGPADRVLSVDLRNTGEVAVDPEITVDLGRGTPGAAPAPVAAGPLRPGEARTVEVPFTLAAPAVGGYRITGRVDGAGATVSFAATTTAWPWLLPVGLLVLVLAVPVARRVPLRVGGGLLITAGAACAVVLAVQVLAPGRETAHAQRALEAEVRAQWPVEDVTTTRLEAPERGRPMAVLHVPRWRARLTVVEGTGTADLRKGPGHYPGTALPGELGNMAVAGHRGAADAPFNDIDRLRSGDAIVVETAAAWHLYRVERHVIVAPDRVDVVAETPERPGVAATRAMLTLTACHPRYSSRQRYVSFAALELTRSKADGPSDQLRNALSS